MASGNPKASAVGGFFLLLLIALALTVWPTLYKSTGQNAAGQETREHRFTGKRQVFIKDAGWVEEAGWEQLKKDLK